MAKFPSLVLTTDGLDMLAKAGSGKEEDKLIITKARLGDGAFSGNFRELKNVVSPKLDALLSSIVNEGNGKIQATFTYTNNEVEAGFHHREIGILAKNGTTGQEKLLSYANAGNYSSYLPDKTEPIPLQTMILGITIGDLENVEGEVNLSNAITEGRLKEELEKYLPLSGGTMAGLLSLFSGSTITTPEANDNSKKIVNSEWVQDFINDFLVGNVIYRPFLQEGYVKLNGATVQREDYPRLVQYATDNSLFTADNSTTPWLFGQGDGETTFVLPDYRNVFIEGGDTPSKINAGLPNITGSLRAIYLLVGSETNYTGVFYSGQAGGITWDNAGSGSLVDCKVNFDASRFNNVYGTTNTVQPPAIVLIPQIKY